MNVAVILAAGSSKRFGKDKLLEPVLKMPVLYYTIQVFHDHPEISEVHVVVSAANEKAIRSLIKKYHFPRVVKFVRGGKERQDSVRRAIGEMRKMSPRDVILVHNGANPLVTADEIGEVIASVQKFGSAAVGKKIVDTVKELRNGKIIKTHDREKLAGMQTPQGATLELFRKAMAKAAKEKKVFTDDASLMENLGHKVHFVHASEYNFKITTAHDYEKMKVIMGDVPKNFLVGLGQDSHAFDAKKKGLRLGGIMLKNEPKLEADSDGDVILHALCNAISQALGEGSLGRFATSLANPSASARSRGERAIKDSKKYLAPLLAKVRRKGFELNNIGIMLECARPKIDPLVPALKKSLGAITGVSLPRIGITATSGEKLTGFGQGKGVQCFAIVSLKKT